MLSISTKLGFIRFDVIWLRLGSENKDFFEIIEYTLVCS